MVAFSWIYSFILYYLWLSLSTHISPFGVLLPTFKRNNNQDPNPFIFFFFFLQLKGLISNLWIPNHQTLTDFRTLVLHLTTTNQYHTYCFRGNFKWLINRILQLTGVTGGRGAPHFPRLQTTLNPKFTFPHLGQVQSPSFREAGIGKHDNFKQLNWKRQITW